MGYRMDVRCVTAPLEYYGTKLYGYVDDMCLDEILKSAKYLKELGKIDDYTFWDYGCDNDMTLTKEQFEKFAALYEEDMREYVDKSFRWNDEMKEIIKADSDKKLSWG